MKLRVVRGTIEHIRDQIVAAGMFEGTKTLDGAARTIDALTGGMVSKVIASGDFKAALNQTLLLYPAEGLQTRRVLLVGLGKRADFTRDRLRGASAGAARAARDRGLSSLVMPSSFVQQEGFTVRDKAEAFVEGALLGLYRFDAFKSSRDDEGKKEIKTFTLLVENPAELDAIRAQAGRAETVARACLAARDLVSRPGNSATPDFLARAARGIARRYSLGCRVLSAREAHKLGMGAFLSVARGSDEPARFIILDYKPPRRRTATATVVLIGKAITFDSGGISLKPANNLEEMKTDMAGGAAVLGVLQAAAELKLPVRVVGLVPAAENLPSGHALKPGDVITALSGKTIEIISTDAEGRLILADALAYARRYQPDAIIDLATLTGACVIALGNHATGIMGNNERLIEAIRRAGETTGERTWPLPLWEEYGEQIKSDIADIKNVGGREAGAITAGYFLKEFAGDAPWAHLDIAGTAWIKKDRPYIPKGATGVGVRLLVSVLENWVKL